MYFNAIIMQYIIIVPGTDSTKLLPGVVEVTMLL